MFGQISQVELSKTVSARTQRRGRKDHQETSSDIHLSGNYSNRHAGEWHLMRDISHREQRQMPLIQIRSYDIQTLLTTSTQYITQ